MIDVSAEQLNIILNILKQHVPEYEVRAFGSRHTWTAKDYSDLDLAVVGEAKLDWQIISNLKEAFEESDLPFRVDVLDWHAISPKFRAVIEAGFEVIQKRLPVRGRTQTEGLDMRDKGWENTTWGEIATLEYGKSLRDYQSKQGDVPVYGTNGLIGCTDKTLCLFPSVIVWRKGAYRGIHYSSRPFFVIDTAFYLKPKTNNLDLKYAYYQLLTQDINSMDSGSAIPSTSREDFYNLELNLPPLPTQRRIAAILSALDDKIELNRQTNQTLEAIAQAIFKEWFVDFRFPHSPLEGWQAKPDGVDSSLRPCPTSGTDSLQAKPAPLSSWQKNSLFPFWALPKNHTLQERAKELRKQGILSEVVFWKAFKDKKKLGWDIDRQVIIGNFIVDFFIPELGLVFEIDGSSHNDKQAYDQERDAFLSSLQLKVVRISDKDVLRNIEGVWSFVTESIKDRVEELKEESPPRPSGLKEKHPPRPSGLKEKHPPRPSGTPQEGNNPPRQASPATPQEGNKYKDDGGEMQESELGPIPKGWRVGKLGEILKLSNETINPGLYPEMEYFHYSIPAFDDGGIPKREKGNSILSNKFKVKSYSLLVSKLNPRIPRIWPIAVIDEEKSICSTEFQVFLPIAKNFYSFGIILFSQSAIIETMKSRATGTSGSHQRIKPQDILDIEIIIPDNETLKHYERIVSEHYQRIVINTNESATLAAIRDALLPKLMNGEIEV